MNQMNIHMATNPNVVVAAPNVGTHMQGGAIMQQQSPQQMQPGPAMPQQPQQDKMDNISKVKNLMDPLRESLAMTLTNAGHYFLQNQPIDSNSQKGTDNQIKKIHKSYEEFHSICDQMELHLETSLSYPQYLNTVRLQISHAKDIHDTLVAAAQNMSPTE